jgi:hypothetical protein
VVVVDGFDTVVEVEGALAGLLQQRPELAVKAVATFCPFGRRDMEESAPSSAPAAAAVSAAAASAVTAPAAVTALLPRRLWSRLVTENAKVPLERRWGSLTSKERLRLAASLAACPLKVVGKGLFKDEFVTCGGVKLKQVDLRRMESKNVPGLFFAGEVSEKENER